MHFLEPVTWMVAWAVLTIGAGPLAAQETAPAAPPASATGSATVSAPATTASAPASSSAPAGALLLRQRLAPGRYVAVQTTELSQEVTADGAKRPTQRFTQALEVTLEAGAAAGDGSRPVTMLLRHLKQRIESGEHVISYDSQGPPGAQDRNLAAVHEALRAAPIVATLAADGTVKDVRGLEAVWEHLAREAPANAPLVHQMKPVVAEALAKGLSGSVGELLPPLPVSVGQSWQAAARFDLPFGGQQPYTAQCRLAEVQDTPEGELASVDFSGELDISEPSVTRMGNTELTLKKLTLSQTGRFQINVQTGMVVARTIRQTGQMDLLVVANDGTGAALTLGQELQGNYSLRPQQAADSEPARPDEMPGE